MSIEPAHFFRGKINYFTMLHDCRDAIVQAVSENVYKTAAQS